MKQEDFKIPKEHLGKGRDDSECIDLSSYYMAVAMTTGLLSRDPSTQVGACIIDKEGNILSTGYNCPPKGWPSDEFIWKKLPEEELNKYTYITHAEMNALANYSGDRRNLDGASIYVTFLPCPNCAKNMVQYGIKKVVYLGDGDNNLGSTKATKFMFKQCGVKCIPFSKENLENLKKVVLNLKSTDARNYATIKKGKSLKLKPNDDNNDKER